MKKFLPVSAVIAIVFCLVSCKQPSAIQVVPESVGMSPERLSRIDTLLQSAVDSGWIAGAVGFIARDGYTVYHKAFGYNDREADVLLEPDAIFRIASQTKAITSVAVMMLFEDGRLLLDDAVSKYIPEFANPVVLDNFNPRDTTYTTKPAYREITIRDLLTHTSGLDYAGIGSPVMRAIYAKNDIPPGFESRPLVLGERMKVLGGLPLFHQPGERFTYGLNTDVLGYLVEVVSGMSLDRFMRLRIFEPLEMADTYFYLPGEKHSRLVNVYTEGPDHKAVKFEGTVVNGIDLNYPLAQGTYFSGGGGLVSTIGDYARFLQMLLNKGEYNGQRILSPRTVELMTSNQIGNLSLGVNKFGLGFEITTESGEAILGVSSGSFAWGGFWGTTYWADPDKKLVCLLFGQQYPLSHGEIGDKFTALVYAALVD